jgi:ribose transport system permease protein
LGKFKSALQKLRRFEVIGVAGALFILCALLTFTTDSFMSSTNLLQVARQASYYGIMAVGMVFVLAMGEIDLSVGSILTLVNIVTAIALRDKVPVPIALLIGLGAGAACGFVNGVLTVILRIPTIVVTLGTMSIFRGLMLVWCNATPISQFSKDQPFFTFGGGAILGLPASVVVMLVMCAAGAVLFYQTPFGWRVQAIGSNLQAARFSGIPIAKYRIAVMTLNGVIAAIAGIMALAFWKSASPNIGLGDELYVIASAIIGGTALSGGSGSIVGGILGALIIAVIRNGLVLLGYNSYWGTAVTGVVIILAVAISSLIKRK